MDLLLIAAPLHPSLNQGRIAPSMPALEMRNFPTGLAPVESRLAFQLNILTTNRHGPARLDRAMIERYCAYVMRAIYARGLPA